MVNITDMERRYLTALASSEFGDYLGDACWIDCVWHDLGKSARGVAASLAKKGVIHHDDDTVSLTQAGIELVVALDLPNRKMTVAEGKAADLARKQG